MVDVKLAGFNVDIQGLTEKLDLMRRALNSSLKDSVFMSAKLSLLKQGTEEGKDNRSVVLSDYDGNKIVESYDEILRIVKEADKLVLTPETISAAYARISRDPRAIAELREDARKDILTSRKSNQAIIFTMGHKSIAEHVFFNFDITGLSRRCVEDLEKKRLQSYTEKSQRYITLDGDYVIPKELVGTKQESLFMALVELQNDFYKNNLEIITDWHKCQDNSELFKSLNIADKPDRQVGTVEGLGKEDARYSLSMATKAQLGYSCSARNLEQLITELRSSDYTEARELGESFLREVQGLAPSVIKYTEPRDYYSKTRAELQAFVSGLISFYNGLNLKNAEPTRVKTFSNLKRDDSIIAGLLFSSSDLSYDNCLAICKKMTEKQKTDLLDCADKYQEKHDPKLREYELGDRVFEMVMSSSAFAQMKRHRMNTLIPQKYLPELRYTTPESVNAVNLADALKEIITKSNELHNILVNSGFSKSIAEYALTNANMRRVLFDCNNRQAYAFCAERENLPAQWDIRATANRFHDEIQKESPITCRSLCGKDRFYDVKNKC